MEGIGVAGCQAAGYQDNSVSGEGVKLEGKREKAEYEAAIRRPSGGFGLPNRYYLPVCEPVFAEKGEVQFINNTVRRLGYITGGIPFARRRAIAAPGKCKSSKINEINAVGTAEVAIAKLPP